MKAKLGIENFRSGQLECINALALHGRDAWVGFACGGGKSLVFAAAMLLLGGVGILIEPLNAISTAMSTYLLARAVKTILLDGTKTTRALAVAALRGDPDQPPVVIIGSPERVLHPAILEAMRSPVERGDTQRILASVSDASLKKSMRSRVSLIGIDEAHTVSQWSEGFRPHFARLGELRAAVQTWDYHSAPMCAMTATATPAVRAAVKISIGFNDERAVEEIQSLCRSNVALGCVFVGAFVVGERHSVMSKQLSPPDGVPLRDFGPPVTESGPATSMSVCSRSRARERCSMRKRTSLVSCNAADFKGLARSLFLGRRLRFCALLTADADDVEEPNTPFDAFILIMAQILIRNANFFLTNWLRWG